MQSKIFKKRGNFILILFLFFGFSVLVFSQDKQGDEEKKLRAEILAVYKSKGEQGLLDLMKIKKDKISNKFIVDFAETGVEERKEEWLKVCEIMAKEKKDEKTLADVLLKTGEYFRLISDYKKASDYFVKALPIYLKLNDPVGQGKVYLAKGIIYFYTGDNSQALEMYEIALPFFEKAGEPIGQGNIYLRKGDTYFYTGDNSRALEMYDKALPFFEKAGEPIGQGNVYLCKGDIHHYTGDNSRAFEMYDKALPFFEKAGEPIGQGNVYRSKGDIYFYTGDNSRTLEMYDRALPFFEKAEEPIGQGNIYEGKGDIYLRIGENSKALEMYDKALPFFEKAEAPIGQGSVYRRKGDIYFDTGDNSRALEMYDKALLFFEKAEEPIGQGNVYLSKGDIHYYTGDNFRAFEMYDKALLFFEKAGYPVGHGNVYLGKGDIYLRIGENSKALEMYDKALPFFEKAGEPLGQGNIYKKKGDIFFDTGDNSRALEMYDEALSFFERPGDPLGQGNVYQGKGDIYFDTGDNSRALEMYDRALLFFEKAGQHIGQGNVYQGKGEICFLIGENSKSLEMYNKSLLFFNRAGAVQSKSYASHGKATVLKKLGKKEKALGLFEKGIANLEKVRTQTVFSEMKRTFMEKVYQQYVETVLFMLENKYDERGFKYAESMKSRVFLDQMSEGLVGLEKGLKLELRKEMDRLVGKLSALSRQMQETGGKNEKKLQKLKEEYRQVESQFEDLLIKIRLDNPLYASVNYPQPVSVRDLQKDVLRKGETLLSYFISRQKAYAFIVSKENFRVKQLKVKENEINGYVERYLLAIKENNANDMKRFGSKLCEKLFKPLEKYLKKSRDIIIVPVGKLETIPFESLIISKKKSGAPVYLMEKYRLKYVQSASLLSILRKHYTRKSTSNGFIGFGDPVYDYENFKLGKPEQGSITRSQGNEDKIKEIHRDRYARAEGIMDRLPHSGEEIKTIARLFEKESLKSVIHLREQAAEEKAKAANMKDFAYIHFSCHGLLNDDFQSLVLSQLPPEKSKEDGYFTLNEIMNCDYNAKLVVLSACQTGSGKMERAEGVTGLTRAVIYAGTPAVVASLWKVDDAATKELMIRFYKNMLEKNLDKTEALRQAKLELIKSQNYSSPLFWSAFVMYGE